MEKRMTRDEAAFQTEIKTSLLAMGAHPVEIPDDSKKAYAFGANMRATTGKPYDMGALSRDDNYAALELKYSKTAAWNFSCLETAQWEGLEAVDKINGRAWVLVHFHFRVGPRQQKQFPGEKIIDQAWALNYKELRAMEKLAYRSLPLCEAGKFATLLPEIGDPKKEEARWDLALLFQPKLKKRR